MRKVAILVLFLFLLSFMSLSCESKAKKLERAKELLNKRCNKCHFSDKIYKKKYSKEGWEDIVNRMVSLSKDAPNKTEIEISHKDAYEILEFLQEESGD